MTREAAALLELLTRGVPRREVYRARDRSTWYVTYGGGQVSAKHVNELVEGGYIQSVYSNCPLEAYHVGKTLDVDATIEERKMHRRSKDAPKIYTDGTRGAGLTSD